MDPETKTFWDARPELWADVQKDQEDPATAMAAYVSWFNDLPGQKVLVAYPAGFDFTFLYWYLIRFTGTSPTHRTCLDMRSYASCFFDTPTYAVGKRTFPKAWSKGLPPHTHRAVEDAREQGLLFLRMLTERRRERKK